MKRTTIYLEPELELPLKLEGLRRGRPMADLVREAVQAYVTREPRRAPPGAGAFSSGITNTAEQADAVLQDTGFGLEEPTGPVKPPRRRPRSRAGR